MDSMLQVAPTILAAFLASLVECVEAMTIVLAVGTVRGWRSAFAGTLAASAVLVALTCCWGPHSPGCRCRACSC